MFFSETEQDCSYLCNNIDYYIAAFFTFHSWLILIMNNHLQCHGLI